MSLYAALIHYPVYNRNREVVATSVTATEIHDASRTCMTFNVKLCYIVTPLERQRQIVDMMRSHWTLGYGARYNPDRAKALSIIKTAETIDHVIKEIENWRSKVFVVGTSAKKRENSITFEELNEIVVKKGNDTLLLFGTGWGLTEEIIERCDAMLEPILGVGDYNHLSVRVAMGIVLDRIFNPRRKK